MKQVLQIKMYPVSYGQGSFVCSTVLKIFNLYFYNNRAIFSRSDWWRAIVNDKPGKWCDDGKIVFLFLPGLIVQETFLERTSRLSMLLQKNRKQFSTTCLWRVVPFEFCTFSRHFYGWSYGVYIEHGICLNWFKYCSLNIFHCGKTFGKM